jgi:hypothetical protein
MKCKKFINWERAIINIHMQSNSSQMVQYFYQCSGFIHIICQVGKNLWRKYTLAQMLNCYITIQSRIQQLHLLTVVSISMQISHILFSPPSLQILQFSAIKFCFKSSNTYSNRGWYLPSTGIHSSDNLQSLVSLIFLQRTLCWCTALLEGHVDC